MGAVGLNMPSSMRDPFQHDGCRQRSRKTVTAPPQAGGGADNFGEWEGETYGGATWMTGRRGFFSSSASLARVEGRGEIKIHRRIVRSCLQVGLGVFFFFSFLSWEREEERGEERKKEGLLGLLLCLLALLCCLLCCLLLAACLAPHSFGLRAPAALKFPFVPPFPRSAFPFFRSFLPVPSLLPLSSPPPPSFLSIPVFIFISVLSLSTSLARSPHLLLPPSYLFYSGPYRAHVFPSPVTLSPFVSVLSVLLVVSLPRSDSLRLPFFVMAASPRSPPHSALNSITVAGPQNIPANSPPSSIPVKRPLESSASSAAAATNGFQSSSSSTSSVSSSAVASSVATTPPTKKVLERNQACLSCRSRKRKCDVCYPIPITRRPPKH